jgi:hypothetical protein
MAELFYPKSLKEVINVVEIKLIEINKLDVNNNQKNALYMLENNL